MIADKAQKAVKTDAEYALGLLAHMLKQRLLVLAILSRPVAQVMHLLKLFNGFLKTSALTRRFQEHTVVDGDSSLAGKERKNIRLERCKATRFGRAEQER